MFGKIGRVIDLQLIRLKREIEVQRPKLNNEKGVVLHHDHTIFNNVAKIEIVWLGSFGASVVQSGPFPDDHFFCSLQNSLTGIKLTWFNICPEISEILQFGEKISKRSEFW